MRLPSAGLQWPFAARFMALEGELLIVPHTSDPGPPPRLHVRYTCATCRADVAPMDRLGVGDQHLRAGVLCGPVEEVEGYT